MDRTRFNDSKSKALSDKIQISVGVAQTANSLDVAKNFNSIKHFLNRFKNEDVDLPRNFLQCNSVFNKLS